MTTATKGMQFFVLRVASNKEDRVREALVRKVKIEGLENVVGRILVPTERVRSIKDGKRRDTDRKLYPGYVFIERTRSVGTRIRPTVASLPSILTLRKSASRTRSSLLLATRSVKNCMAVVI